MSEPIKVGDLVMVVAGCPYCGNVYRLGYTFTVKNLWRGESHSECCGMVGNIPMAEDGEDDDVGWDLRSLKKINPPSLDETTDEREEISA